MIKKLLGGAQWNSSIHVHPKGDNILVGSFDRKVMWFDLDLANTPYKTMKYHNKAVRSVKFHPRYPLFASCSDDCNLFIFLYYVIIILYYYSIEILICHYIIFFQ